MNEWPVRPMKDLYDEMDDPRSGILADVIRALLDTSPECIARAEFHILLGLHCIRSDPRGFPEYMHSVLIEFFDAASNLNRHPIDSKFLSNLNRHPTPPKFTPNSPWRHQLLRDLGLGFPVGFMVNGFTCCPMRIVRPLTQLFRYAQQWIEKHRWQTESVMEKVTLAESLKFTPPKVTALTSQSMPRIYMGKTIMVLVANNMQLNDYVRARTFSSSRSPDNQLIGRLLSDVLNIDIRGMHMEPFSYYCMLPWPGSMEINQAKVLMWAYFDLVKPLVWVTMGKKMAELVVEKVNQPQVPIYKTSQYLKEIGQPLCRRIGKWSFIHVPLLEPSRCRYGERDVDDAAHCLMQTSFWSAMLVADITMRVLEDPNGVKGHQILMATSRRIPQQRSPTESDAIQDLVMGRYIKFVTENVVGHAFITRLKGDRMVIEEIAAKEEFFII
ncbi:hypothetical protein GGS20DRAFT_542740 [Poronia punctata]|nr:hypothetical protein GGS20DRAFT_542740 [Poronia punctata]